MTAFCGVAKDSSLAMSSERSSNLTNQFSGKITNAVIWQKTVFLLRFFYDVLRNMENTLNSAYNDCPVFLNSYIRISL